MVLAVGKDGTLSSAPFDASSAWGPIDVPAPPARVTSDLFLVDTSGVLWGKQGRAWEKFAAPALHDVASLPAKDHEVLFGVDREARLVDTRQNAHGWSHWEPIAAPHARRICALVRVDGEAQVFLISESGAVETARRPHREPYSPWTSWTAILGIAAEDLAAAERPDGIIEVFAIERGAVYMTRQSTPSVHAPWARWRELPDAPRASSVAAAAIGRGVQVWVVDSAGAIWTATQTGDEWSRWSEFAPAAPPPPVTSTKTLDFTMQLQTQSNWCWAAVSTSVSHFFDAKSAWTQCTVANAQTGQTTCCQDGSTDLCNVIGYLDQALTTTGNLDHWEGGTETMANASAQIDKSLPLAVRIGWNGGGGHFVAITGYAGDDTVTVEDPIYGTSVITYETLVTNYQSAGTWTHSYFTKAAV
ncbi:MAG TPA: papain-like cysteine protease family protein [Kofleriaceae bacterium]